MAQKLYAADYIVTQNDARDVLQDSALVIEDGRILCLGHTDMLEIMYPDAEKTDMGHSVILPGLINGHAHVSMSLLRGYSDDKALMDWLQKDIFPQEAKLTPELVELGALFSFAEMVRSGTTAFFDMYMWENSVFRAADSIGLRGVLGESVSKFFPAFAADNLDAYCDLIRGYADAWRNHPRLRPAVTPHAPYTTTPELLVRCRELATETGALFGMHMAETKGETAGCLKEHGLRPIPYCESLNILAPDCVFFHGVDADAHDIGILADHRCCVVHNPASNMKLASGVAPVEAMLRNRVPVGLGTDGPASNNAQNMLREMYLAALLQKVYNLDPQACPAQTALDMATRNGAAVLHDPLIGVLEPGMKADFIALSLDSPNMQPVHNIVSNIVYAATGAENRLTVVDGRELYRDGKFLTCDYEALCGEIKRAERWASR